MSRLFLPALMAAVALCQTPAQAQQQFNRSITAASGTSQEASRHFRFDASCKGYPVSIRITQQPKNGTLKTSRQSVALQNSQVNSSSGACVGKAVPFTIVTYVSKKGFSGSDSFSYVRSSSDPADRSNGDIVTINVTVN